MRLTSLLFLINRYTFYGKNIGDVLNDDEGMANICNLGKNMGAIIKMTLTSKEGNN